MTEFTLERCFPAQDEAVIDPQIGSEQHTLGSAAKVLDRAELDFHFARFRHRRIGAVEWTIGLDLSAPASEHQRRSQRRYPSDSFHAAGRNTQIAAGSCDVARTATSSRSSSGTNSEVRVPDTVGTRASRR